MSSIAWLDASAEEQRRVRELLGAFSVSDTTDELGARKVVIALSDALFPGTSVLHTRARYVLIIPWLAKRSVTAKNPVRRFDELQRRMIQEFLGNSTLASKDVVDGLIGRNAGERVKNLPSTLYWEALKSWGILNRRCLPADLFSLMRGETAQRFGREADELADRVPPVWHHGVGDPPPGFPETDIGSGLRLQTHEAEWLRERWLATAHGSLLAHLTRPGTALDETAWAPWVDAACQSDITNRDLVHDAERFSLALGGGQALYAWLLAERYTQLGYNRVDVDLDQHTERLHEWQSEAADRSTLFEGWSPNTFFDRLNGLGVNLDPEAEAFFRLWFDVCRGSTTDVANDPQLHESVSVRERTLKRSQSRLTNDRLMENWTGAAASRITFRWQQVRRLISDLHEGLAG